MAQYLFMHSAMNDVYPVILAFLDLNDLYQLTAVNKTARAVAEFELKRRNYGIDFRQLFAKTFALTVDALVHECIVAYEREKQEVRRQPLPQRTASQRRYKSPRRGTRMEEREERRDSERLRRRARQRAEEEKEVDCCEFLQQCGKTEQCWCIACVIGPIGGIILWSIISTC